MNMKRSLPAVPSRIPVAAVLAMTSLLVAPPWAQAIVKVNDNVSFRFGAQIQAWADWTQDPATMGYAQNFYLRRARFLMGGQLAPGVTFFFQTENANLGKAPKSLGTGFQFWDYWAEWKITNELRLDAGLIVVPLCRNCLLSTSSFLTLDGSNLSVLENNVTQSSGTRDTGMGFKGYFLGDHLEYRIYAFSGARVPGSRNAYRFAGRVQYDVFDTETGYAYAGTNLGEKKILAFGVGSDNQGAYHAYSGDVAVDIPVNGGDGVGGLLQWVHYDGEDQFTSLLRQNTYLAELGYYFSKVKVQPFLAFQAQRFSDSVNTSTNTDRYSAGLNYYVSGQNLKFTAQFARNAPNGGIPWTNQFTIQMQVFYF